MSPSTHVPLPIASAIAAGSIKKITWASYGFKPESWFFAFELANGKPTFECGRDIPLALASFIKRLKVSDRLLATLRVQLGDSDSFVAWSSSAWACANVPHQLRDKLSVGHCRLTCLTTNFILDVKVVLFLSKESV